MIDYVWLVPVFPLIGFLINGFFGKKLGDLFGRRMELLGGLILISIGVKIVIENL